MLRELRAALEADRGAELENLETQRRQNLERLKAESEEELRAERRRLLADREVQLDSLKQEVRITPMQWMSRASSDVNY